jgi:ribulose-phosphate 3-epimerase
VKLAPSVLAGDLADIRSMLRDMELASCDYVHWDVMDGHFVPNLTFGVPVIRNARQHTNLPFDVHLMVQEPERYIDGLRDLGVDFVSFHIEATHAAPRLCQQLHEAGLRAGVALNPQTPLCAIEGILPLADVILVMSVDPGFAGQSFIAPVWDKLTLLAATRAQMQGLASMDDAVSASAQFEIQVDGGVSTSNIAKLAHFGVDIVVAGKAFFSAPDQVLFAQAVHTAAP